MRLATIISDETEKLALCSSAGLVPMDVLNEKFSSTYKSVIQLKSSTQSQLPIQMLSCSDNHGTILHNILKDYEGKLRTDLAVSLSNALIARLSMEAISDWLGRCPLNFPNVEVNDENY